MNNKINKSVDYVSDEIGYDRVKQIANVVGNMVKNTMQNITNTVQRNDNSETGYDISDNETKAIAIPSKIRIECQQYYLNKIKIQKSVIRNRMYWENFTYIAINEDAEPMTFGEIRKLSK